MKHCLGIFKAFLLEKVENHCLGRLNGATLNQWFSTFDSLRPTKTKFSIKTSVWTNLLLRNRGKEFSIKSKIWENYFFNYIFLKKVIVYTTNRCRRFSCLHRNQLFPVFSAFPVFPDFLQSIGPIASSPRRKVPDRDGSPDIWARWLTEMKVKISNK